jgi:tetrahedral aminopeptidase
MRVFDIKAHLKTLSETHAISGYEAPVQAVLREAWQPLVQAFDGDKLGSFIGIKHATLPNPHARKIMLAAHMDEIGMFVRDIVDGFILVHRGAGMDHRVLLAKPVLVHGKKVLPGLVAATPPHLLTAEMKNHYPEFDQLVIDVGLSHEEVSQWVNIGDPITPDFPMTELMNGYVVGKAFDDRGCVAIMTSCLHYLQTLHHCWDVYATATVQEENGLYGALTSAQHIAPDVAIALDVTFAPQAGVPQDSTAEIGAGGAIGIGVNFHPKLMDMLVDVAKKHEIKYQMDVIAGYSGTDAWSIQTALEGIPTLLVSLPIRNMHSHNETLDIKDIDRVGRLLAVFIASLSQDINQQLDLSS